jgi:hypothetical protein
MSFKTPSYSSPKGGGIRACLCRNGTYSRKCCDGSLQAQGIGNIVRVEPTPIPPTPGQTGFLLQQDGGALLQQDLGKIIITTSIIVIIGFMQQEDLTFLLQQDLSKIIITQ